MIRPFPKITNHPRLRRTKQKIKLHFYWYCCFNVHSSSLSDQCRCCSFFNCSTYYILFTAFHQPGSPTAVCCCYVWALAAFSHQVEESSFTWLLAVGVRLLLLFWCCCGGAGGGGRVSSYESWQESQAVSTRPSLIKGVIPLPSPVL